jgi:phospho-N-acetylmuramoyl-pentapeptide-transferase
VISLIVGAPVSFAASFLALWLAVRIASGQSPRALPGSRAQRLAAAILQSGGIPLFIGITLGYITAIIVSRDPIAPSGLLIMILLAAATALGVAIDFMERRQKSTLFIRRLVKFGGLAVITVGFSIAALQFPDPRGITPASGHPSFVTELNFDFFTLGGVGAVAAILWLALLVFGSATSVSVIEGYDGLAAGLTATAMIGYVFVTAWQYNQSCAYPGLARENLLKCYPVRDPKTLTEIVAILIAALIAFVWWNTYPAQVQLGESGSFLLGSSLAAISILTHTELLLVALCTLLAIFTRVALPSRVTRTKPDRWQLFAGPSRRGRLRIAGTSEVTIVVRFWIIAALLSGVGVIVFYLTWAAQ